MTNDNNKLFAKNYCSNIETLARIPTHTYMQTYAPSSLPSLQWSDLCLVWNIAVVVFCTKNDGLKCLHHYIVLVYFVSSFLCVCVSLSMDRTIETMKTKREKKSGEECKHIRDSTQRCQHVTTALTKKRCVLQMCEQNASSPVSPNVTLCQSQLCTNRAK